jgi:hypothetical protein
VPITWIGVGGDFVFLVFLFIIVYDGGICIVMEQGGRHQCFESLLPLWTFIFRAAHAEIETGSLD